MSGSDGMTGRDVGIVEGRARTHAPAGRRGAGA
ncbi:hypothetical protein ATKI12_2893 [Kitasatospora sp. Ki12]